MLELGSACHIFDREPRPCTSQSPAFSVSFATMNRVDGHPDSALYIKMEPGGVVKGGQNRKKREKKEKPKIKANTNQLTGHRGAITKTFRAKPPCD